MNEKVNKIKNLYVNCKVRFNHGKGYIIAVLPSGKVIPIIDLHMRLLEYISQESFRDKICCYINDIEPGIDPNKVIDIMIDNGIIVESEASYQWPGMTYGASLIDKEEEDAVLNVIRSRKLFRHENISVDGYKYQPKCFINDFEERIKKMLDIPHFLAVSSGTCALDALLDAFDITYGDEVIIPSFAYIGIVSILIKRGIVPVICDIDEFLMLSSADVEKKFSAKTKAIICMHYRGRAAQIHSLAEIAKKNKIILIEDCAQAIGTSLNGKMLGTFGDAGYFSFHQHKLITCGEGGGICIKNSDIYKKLQLITDASRLFAHRDILPGIPGSNYRMSELHAALGCCQLDRLDGIVSKLMELYEIFVSELEGLEKIRLLPLQPKEYGGVQSLCLQVKDRVIREKLVEYTRELGIDTVALYTKDSYHHDIYLNWAYAIEKIGLVDSWVNDRDRLHEIYPRTLEILSHTITIPLGIGVSKQSAYQLACDIKAFHNNLEG